MKNLKLKFILAFVVLSASIFAPFLPVSAIDCSAADAKTQIQCGACEAAGATAANCNPATAPSSLNNTIHDAVNILSVLAGAAAVVMIIVGGFRYVTSSGNPESIKSARNTIVYAVIGLIIVALAQIIVHFTIDSVSCVNGKTSTGQKCT